VSYRNSARKGFEMSKERGAVVSVRITDDEQARLRDVAKARGTSVSELVRSVVEREMSPQLPVGAAVSVAPLSQSSLVERGIFWSASEGSTSPTPGTINIRG
jgi:uncharacterized protein DUF6290